MAAFCLAILPGASATAAATHRAAAAPGTAGGTFGHAMKVPGLAALGKGGAVLVSVSCASPGNCGAGGQFVNGSGHTRPFVVSQTHGRWGNAIRVPGIAALTAYGAGIDSVSCGSVGDCSAAGGYRDRAGHFQVFVVNEVNGTWGKAQQIPGTGALNSAGAAGVVSLSCGSAGNCAVAGTYFSHAHCPMQIGCNRAFVADETNGTWGRAIQVPGTAALAPHGLADIDTVSCASAGSCAAGGDSVLPGDHNEAWVASEANGRWSKAIPVPGLAALNRGGGATTGTVSCGSAGFCGAGGFYADRSGREQAFVVSEIDGHWGTAIEVPGTAALNTGGNAMTESVSCASAGFCSAGGTYAHSGGGKDVEQVFVANEVDGVWHTAIEVPGSAALNTGGNASINSVSCAPANNCGAGGFYTDTSGREQAFVVTETNGTWGTAIEVPGSAALNTGGEAQITSVSCTAAGKCSAGGLYTVAPSERHNAFVVSES